MVTRYCIDVEDEDIDFYSYESTCGDYVMYDDYENLASEYDALKDRYDALVKKLGEIYLEG